MTDLDPAAGADPGRWRQALGIGESFTLDELIAKVQADRGRPMEIIEMPELIAHGDALCGLWMATDERDIVLHAPSDSVLHRQQFILHELAHMILRHDRSDFVFTPKRLLSSIEPGVVVKALARDSIDSDFELAAEALADDLAHSIRAAGKTRSRFFDIFG